MKEFAIIAITLIWGIVIIACSLALKGSGLFQDIQLILGAGAVSSLFIITVVDTIAVVDK